MSTAALVFPHQLYRDHPAIDHADRVVMVEEPLFFGDAAYPLKLHKQKLILHRASMRKYYRQLQKSKSALYREHDQADLQKLCQELKQEGADKLVCLDPTDDWLNQRLHAATRGAGLPLVLLPNPGFLNTAAENRAFFGDRQRYTMQRFYEWQRKRFGILLENDESPVGGK